MLVAPAGYGKTTLAEQWTQREGRRCAWFTARSSSSDVAALALGIATATTDLVPGCDARLREHLRAVPADDVETIADILAEDLADWPSDGWLVLDEYDEIARSPHSERFVAALVERTLANVLIASRQRPSWATPRRLLYGEYFEVGQSALAMDRSEAADVLAEEDAEAASGLVALANGWPAVIGLAAVAGAELGDEVEEVPEALFRFFADEVYSALSAEVQQGLARLAIAPILDDALVRTLLGADRARLTREAAVSVGLLVERGDGLELHPLCRTFLRERGPVVEREVRQALIAACLDHYRASCDWDAAFDLVVRNGCEDELEGLLREALDEFLDTGRLSTIEEWTGCVPPHQARGAVAQVALAEVDVRRGRFTTAKARAEAAAAEIESGLAFRALAIAGRAAHLASLEKEGLELYRRAEAVAASESERRDALWGQFICAVELELPEMHAVHAELMQSIDSSSPRDVVRSHAHSLHYRVKSGLCSLSDADRAYELSVHVSDPIVLSSFQSTYSVVLSLCCRYKEATLVASEFLETVESYRLEFALPYALYSLALASAGRREWDEAERSLREALTITALRRDENAGQLAYALLLRVLAQQARYAEALALETPSLARALRSSAAEVLASRALVLACVGRGDDALSLVREGGGLSSSVEARVLFAGAEAATAVRARGRRILERVRALEDAAFTSGGLDLLVTSYRACPELLELLFRVTANRDRLAAFVRRAGDEDLAAAAGLALSPDEEVRSRLSPREREVYELLSRGLGNREIAEALVISPATAKRHVQNIFDKLGIRSRRAIAVRAALARGAPSQATAAIGSDSGDGSITAAPKRNSDPRAIR